MAFFQDLKGLLKQLPQTWQAQSVARDVAKKLEAKKAEAKEPIIQGLPSNWKIPELSQIKIPQLITPETLPKYQPATTFAPRITPPSIDTQESKLKDISDTFNTTVRSLAQGGQKYLLTTLPKMLFPKIKAGDPIQGILKVGKEFAIGTYTEETAKRANEKTEVVKNILNEKYKASEKRYQSWITKNPQLQPRPEWQIPITEAIKTGDSVLKDPGYYANMMAQAIPFTVGVMGTTVLVSKATGSPMAGMVAGLAVATPIVSQELYEDLIKSGANEQQAADLTKIMGPVIAGVEVVSDIPILQALGVGAFKNIFKQQVRKEIVKLTTRQVIQKGLLNFAKIEVIETLEEVVQQAIQNATVQTIDKTRGIFEGIAETTLKTLISTVPMALLGLGKPKDISQAFQGDMQSYMENLDAKVKELQAKGYSFEEARALVLSGGYIGELPPKPEKKVVVPEVPKELQPLAQEARKAIAEGKSAEEFVEAQPMYYHGTPKEFEKFDLSFVGERGRTEGRGFYFTDKKSVAESYRNIPGEQATGGRVVEAYLDIKKPMSLKQRKITDSQLKEIIKEASKLNESLIPSYGDNLNDVVKLLKENKTDVDIISELGNVGVPAQELNNIITRITGYDGIIQQMPDGKLLVAFTPEQVLTKSQLTDFYQAVKGEVEPGIPGVKGLEAVGLKPEPSPLIVRRETTLLKDRITNIARGAREGTINTREQIKATQTELIDIIEKSELELNDKAKFLRTVKNIQTTEQLQKALPEIENRIVKLGQAELGRGLQSQIDRELKYVKPIKVGQKRIAKYDYQTNKFLEGLRASNKLNQEQAQVKLDKMPTEGLTELDKIEARFLSLKANGAKASVLLHEQVLADIRNLKEIGEVAKDEADFVRKIEKQEKVDEVLKGVNQQKRVLRKLGDVYISSIANLYSTINTIAGKNIADKYDYGMFQTNSQYDFSEQVDKATNKAKEIYGLKNNRQLTNVFIDELTPTNWTITDTTGLKTEISRFNLIDIYNATKNDLVKERYNNAFGEEQVNALLQNLTEEDVRLADYLMDEVQEYRGILNQRSIETTGRDLGEVENYWPSTSEYEVDFYDDVRTQGETPSAMKARAKSSKIFPRIDNAWLKYQRHIAQGEHVRTLSKKYEELKNLFSDRIVKNTIKNKFGDESYTALMDHIETFSLNKRVQSLDIFSGIYNTALNNWVKAKIASPTVFARQLISSIYSVEKVGAINFLKYQTEVIKNPAEAFKYMWDNIPFLRIRFKQGYSEALQDAIKGTSNLKVGMDSITKYVTLLTRGGDISAIIVNGYPIIKTEMAKHGNMQKAIEEFQKFTEKTQQSGTRANLSRLQRERNAFARTFFRFKNTTNQLLRLQTDATVQFLNKDISAQAFATKTALYSIYTPMMYVLIGYLITQGFKKVFGTDDEEKEKSLLGDILAQIIIQPYQALPFVDMAVENAYAEIRKRLTGKGYYFGGGMFSYPLLDDIETAWSKLRKKEPTASDLLRVFSLLQEPVTGIPTETILRYYGYTQKEEPTKTKSKPFNAEDMIKKYGYGFQQPSMDNKEANRLLNKYGFR